jgi:RNA polymerase sigma-70 factor (ECF subfamily)
MPEIEDLPILAEIGDQLKAGFRRRETARRPPGGRFAALAAGAAIAVIAVLAWGVGGGGFGSTEASAAQALRAAADAAARQTAFSRPNEFFFISWRSTSLVQVLAHADKPLSRAELSLPKALVSTETSEHWSPTRVGEISTRLLRVSFPTAAARTLWDRIGRPPLGGILGATGITPVTSIALNPKTLTLAQIVALPTDPSRLYRRLFADASAQDAVQDVEALDSTPIAPRLFAALYRALALVPGVSDDGDARTLTGRVGEAIGAGGDQLIIDWRTGKLLGYRYVVEASDAAAENLPAGTVFRQTAIVARVISMNVSTPHTQR